MSINSWVVFTLWTSRSGRSLARRMPVPVPCRGREVATMGGWEQQRVGRGADVVVHVPLQALSAPLQGAPPTGGITI
jgi:hypothetical protein